MTSPTSLVYAEAQFFSASEGFKEDWVVDVCKVLGKQWCAVTYQIADDDEDAAASGNVTYAPWGRHILNEFCKPKVRL